MPNPQLSGLSASLQLSSSPARDDALRNFHVMGPKSVVPLTGFCWMDAPSRKLAQQAREAQLTKMEKVTRSILDPAPSWLGEVFLYGSVHFMSQHLVDDGWPTKKQMWDTLAEAAQSAFSLYALLQKTAVVDFLLATSELKPETLGSLSGTLLNIASCAVQACQSPVLVDKNGARRKGRGKALLPRAMPARYICAAVVSEVICFLVERGVDQPSKDAAYIAADLLWKAWPGHGIQAGTTNPKRIWTRYFDAVDDPRLKSIRVAIREHLLARSGGWNIKTRI